MSRSNTHYYNLCNTEIGPDGLCVYCRRRSIRRQGGNGKGHCIGPNTYMSRRGLVVRKNRFPNWGWKRYGRNPPKSIKQIWNRQARHEQDSELRRTGDILFDSHKWLGGMYGWWL